MTATLSRPAPSGQAQRLLPNRQEAPRRTHWHLLISAASFAAVMLTSLSLSGVIFGWTWFTPVMVTVGTVLFFMALSRWSRLPGYFAPLVGVVALAGSLIWQFFPGQSTLGFFPGEGFVGRLSVLLGHAENTVVSQVAPVLPTGGLFLVVCAGIGIIAILVDTLANTLRMPATSGLALLAILVVPAVVRINSVGVPSFVAAVAGYLLLLGTAHWLEARQDSASSGELSGAHLSRGLTIGALALGIAVVLPLAIPGFNSGVFPQGARVNLWGTATGLNPIVTLGNDLRNPNGFGRIEYATTAEEPLYLRSVTLEDFSGQRWEPDQRLGQRVAGVEEMAGDGQPPGETVLTRIDTESFTSPWLLAPYAPVSINGLNGRWAYDPGNLSILAIDGGSTADQDYLVESTEPVLTRERLQAIPATNPEAVPEQFLALPGSLPGIIRDTTASVVEGISNPYSQAIAIQSYLRGPSFVYSVDAPVDGGYDGNSLDVMARFLESKSGYCVHYAGTMAVMARLAGIPSRVAVGYSPGTPTGEQFLSPDGVEFTEYSVNSKDAHAWPELYFEGVGWVQFEPTPSRGVVPDYALSSLSPVSPSIDNDSLNPGVGPVPPSTATPSPEAEEAETADAARESSERSSTLGVVLALLLVVLALTPMAWRVLRTRRRRRSVTANTGGVGAATMAWAETVEVAADYGLAPLPTDTPRTFEQRLRERGQFDDAAAGAIVRLRRSYEEEEYAEFAGADIRTSNGWDDVQAVTEALRRSASLPARVRARLWPRSLWQPFGAQRSEDLVSASS
ncbi:transglutaminase TgpA family protein [Arthrobacter sp. D2-10]